MSPQTLASIYPESGMFGWKFHPKAPPLEVASVQTPPLRKPTKWWFCPRDDQDHSHRVFKLYPRDQTCGFFLPCLLTAWLEGYPGALVSIKPGPFLIKIDLVWFGLLRQWKGLSGCRNFSCMSAHSAFRGQKSVLEPWEMKVWMVRTQHLCSGIQTWVLWNSRRCFLFLNHLSKPSFSFFICTY